MIPTMSVDFQNFTVKNMEQSVPINICLWVTGKTKVADAGRLDRSVL